MSDVAESNFSTTLDSINSLPFLEASSVSTTDRYSAEEGVERLCQLMSDVQVVDTFLSRSPKCYRETLKASLSRINAHVNGMIDDACKQHEATTEADGPPTKKLKLANKKKEGERSEKKTSPFQCILRKKYLAVKPEIVEHITKFGTSAEAFLNTTGVTHQNPEHTHRVADAWMSCYRYTKRLMKSMESDRYRFLFQMQNFHDIIKLLKPGCSGNQIGELMERDLVAFLTPVAGLKSPNDFNVQIAADEMHKWCRYGAKINILTEEFGVGVIFYLEDVLSNNFLINLLTASGSHYDKAMAHLRVNLRLEDLLKNNPAVEQLANNVREHLIIPFVSYKHRLSTKEGAEMEADLANGGFTEA